MPVERVLASVTTAEYLENFNKIGHSWQGVYEGEIMLNKFNGILYENLVCRLVKVGPVVVYFIFLKAFDKIIRLVYKFKVHGIEVNSLTKIESLSGNGA